MRYIRLCLMATVLGGLTFAGNPAGDDKSGSTGTATTTARLANAASHRPLPPVLRDPEPSDSMVVRLPGPKPVVRPNSAEPAPEMIAKATEPTVKLDPAPPGTLEDPGRPILKRAPKAAFPPNFEKDSAVYCQKLIGSWSLEDATMLLGDPRSSRPAYDDQKKQNGTIYAFSDPTGRYRQIELDFDADSGSMRTVFGYPWNLTWQDCRKLWGANVSAAEANKGRRFYSYLNRRLDVLVDQGGKVISLGLY